MSASNFEIELAELRPTQSAVGLEEVQVKRRQWRARSREDKAQLLLRHIFPIVRGPGRTSFLLDGHHLAYALQQEGVRCVNARLADDLAALDVVVFKSVMEKRGYINPYDRDNWAAAAMPERLAELGDDPFRSLVAKVRRYNRCPKSSAPFAEFHWAHFLRSHSEFDIRASSPEQAINTARRLIWDGLCSSAFPKCLCFERA